MKLYLVDASIFIYQAWFSSRHPQFNRCGEPNHAFIGFSDFVYQLLNAVNPEKLVFAFDESSQESRRQLLYPQYKAQRKPTPLELKRQFVWCRQWIHHLGISAVSDPQWEADDLIGTLATLHRSPKLSIVILTMDKDLTQIIREGDLWWSFYGNRKLDYCGIKKKFGVNPEQISEHLALTGDASDNIPGIPLVGRKTAASLLRQFKTLSQLRNNLTQVSSLKFRYASQVQQSLIEHESILDISSALTQINCQVATMQDVSIHRNGAHMDQLREMMHAQAMDSQQRQKWETCLATFKSSRSDY